MKYLLHQLAPTNVLGELRRIRDKYLRKLRRTDQQVVTLEPVTLEPAGDDKGEARGRVLLSYIIDPFLLDDGADVPYSHTHFWETRTIARVWTELGFRVDAISWTNLDFEPEHDYDVVIDVRLNLQRLAPRLPRKTLKILHTDTAHYTFNNPAQEARRQALAERRGVVVRPQRMLPENRAAEIADAIVYLGNDFTGETYAFAGKPSYRVPVSVPFTYDWQAKDFDAVRRRFLWFGSGGLVHKGLDLVLDAFAGMPDHHLTVCGPVRRERDFERTYFRELYETPNISTLGWVDVGRPEFLDLARRTLGLVYPSCAEGGGSSALTCLHAGLIPVLTRETSVDLDPSYGIELGDVTVEGIRAAVRELSERPAAELEAMARAAWTFARDLHSKEHFEDAYRRLAARLMNDDRD